MFLYLYYDFLWYWIVTKISHILQCKYPQKLKGLLSLCFLEGSSHKYLDFYDTILRKDMIFQLTYSVLEMSLGSHSECLGSHSQ